MHNRTLICKKHIYTLAVIFAFLENITQEIYESIPVLETEAAPKRRKRFIMYVFIVSLCIYAGAKGKTINVFP